MAKRKTNGKQQKPEPMIFEYKAPEKTEYDLLSDRVMNAVTELNNALQAAHECAEMRVFLALRDRSTDHAMSFQPQIYRLTHSTMAFTVKFAKDDEPQWRAVKDPAFRDAAGVGLSAIEKKRAGARA